MRSNYKNDIFATTFDYRSRETIERVNSSKVTKINLGAELSEIKRVLDYDESILEGISSLLRLIHSPDFITLSENQYLGPIFKIVEFKENVDIGMKAYFRVS